jgi:acetyl-CoA C-acetyltransferase
MTADPIVIASYARTPIGSFQGELSPMKATELGASAVRAALERSGLGPDAVDQIVMGCVKPPWAPGSTCGSRPPP